MIRKAWHRLLNRLRRPKQITSTTAETITCAPTGYSDEQFYADLSKVSKALDYMAAKALRDDNHGRTRKFPA